MRKHFIPAFEFWPIWAIYFPIIPYCVWIAFKNRNLRWIFWVNPSETFSGLLGEFKYERLLQVPASQRPSMKLFTAGDSSPIESVLESIQQDIKYPCIIKANAGYRGGSSNGFPVTVVPSAKQARIILENATEDLLIQAYSTKKQEYGVFIIRLPDSKTGTVTSLMQRQFLSVIGNGTDTAYDLLQADERNNRYAQHIKNTYPEASERIPQQGETMVLETIGNHCRGTTFTDQNHQIGETLTQTFIQLAQDMDHLYYARFDVKADSFKALENGDFEVMEVNGLNAEPVHMYSENYPFMQGWKDLIWHWKQAGIIANQNYKKGLKPVGPTTFRAIYKHLKKALF